MAKFTVVKKTVFIVEAENDAEANNIITRDLAPGLRNATEDAMFIAEYTDVYQYGVGDSITQLAMEYEPEQDESRRVVGYE